MNDLSPCSECGILQIGSQGVVTGSAELRIDFHVNQNAIEQGKKWGRKRIPTDIASTLVQVFV